MAEIMAEIMPETMAETMLQLEPSAHYTILCLGSAERQKWLELRLQGIGASEMPYLLGLNPHKSALELYLEKTGQKEFADLSGNEAVWWGRELEPLLLKRYRYCLEKAGIDRQVAMSGVLLRSSEYPWALATLDAIGRQGEDFLVIEFKTTSLRRLERWSGGVPDDVMAQVQQQLLVTGLPRASVACLIGGQRMVWADIEPEEEWKHRIVVAGERFWERVQQRRPPEPDGSPSSRRALNLIYPPSPDKVIELPPALKDDSDWLQRAKGQIAELQYIQRFLENKIISALGEAQRGIFPDGSNYSRKKQTRAEHKVKACEFYTLTFSPGGDENGDNKN